MYSSDEVLVYNPDTISSISSLYGSFVNNYLLRHVPIVAALKSCGEFSVNPASDHIQYDTCAESVRGCLRFFGDQGQPEIPSHRER